MSDYLPAMFSVNCVLNYSLFSILVNMRDINVHGLQGFVINHVDFVLMPLNFQFDFSFPVLRLVGRHRTIAQIAGVIPVPLSGEGPFTMVIRSN